MALSQNGWLASSSPSSFGGLYNGMVPGTTVKLAPGIRNGDVALVAFWFAAEFHRTVEPLIEGWCWGYAYRAVRAGNSLSNHSSATAWDLNAPRHPLGKAGTFSPTQVARIRELLAFLEGAVRWGGNYSGRKDEMHFEVVTTEAGLRYIANKIRATGFTLTTGLASPAPVRPSPHARPAGKDGVWVKGDDDGPNGTVNHIQWRLNVHGFKTDQDGNFGDKTEANVIAFQTKRNIGRDGKVGPETLHHLNLEPVSSVPPFPGVTREGMRNSAITRAYQQRLKDRGWKIVVDDDHGPTTTKMLHKFQAEKGLRPDGVGGPDTWRALWTTPVT